MLFEYRYFGASTVASGSQATGISFAPDVRRAPTFLRAEVRNKLVFRECLSALHDVVVSDLRFKPKDRTEYLAWRRQQDELDVGEVARMQREAKARYDAALAELGQLRARVQRSRGPFESAKQRFFKWLYTRSLEAWFVLDPVVTVHPDEVAFECFSQDESSYGRVACSHEVFTHLGEVAYGTTNVDYSQGLYDEFQKIRDYKTTSLAVDPGGFEVATAAEGEAAEAFREVKIDLPDTWVRGFLQVSSAMALPAPAARLRLHPTDVFNLCFHLRRRKEKHGPRSLRFLLAPGQPVRVRVEPFDLVVDCPRSPFTGSAATEIRVWGRRRLLTLERLLPVARHVDVLLLGSGMPSFWLVDCGEVTYTLGLSGWTSNDWSQSGNFDLLAPRGEVDAATLEAVWRALGERWSATGAELSAAVGRDLGAVDATMLQLTQAGRAMFDLHRGVWRRRELVRDPLDLAALRFSNEREARAAALAFAKGVAVGAQDLGDGGVRLTGQVGSDRCSLVLDGDRRLRTGECTCRFHFQNKLRQGPCEHLLALRLAHERRLGQVLEAAPPQPSATRGPAPPPRPGPPPGGRVDEDDRPQARNGPTRAGTTLRRPGGPEPFDFSAAQADNSLIPVPDSRPAPGSAAEEAKDSAEGPRRGRKGPARTPQDEARRLTDELLGASLVELEAGTRGQFERDVAAVLAGIAGADRRAALIYRLFDRPYVAEHYVPHVDELAVHLERWGFG